LLELRIVDPESTLIHVADVVAFNPYLFY